MTSKPESGVKDRLLRALRSPAASVGARWLCVALALAVFLLLVHMSRFIVQLALAFLLTVGCIMLLCLPKRVVKSDKAVRIILCALAAVIVGYFAFGGAMLYSARHVTYKAPKVSREIFSNKSVLIIVPHEDDEINLCGGIIGQYDASCDVHVLFTTNGDYQGGNVTATAADRYQEAIDSLRILGVPKENIIFLGYGDTFGEGVVHMYNMPNDEIYTSSAGRTHTYGAIGIEPFSSSDYTRANMIADIKGVITGIRPDVIFCLDYDSHVDHRALSLFFEEAMGEILAQGGYTPDVYKGFAYSCAWYAPDDYYAENILPTVNLGGELYMTENNVYDWDARVRFPVAESTMSRSLQASDIYKAFLQHRSQRAQRQAGRVASSDRVYWKRDTNSLLYGAGCIVSSGEAKFLTDFKLTDCSDINSDLPPFENVWQPAPEDKERYAQFSFDQPQTLTMLRLYDHPSLDDNVLSVRVSFSDGSTVEYGALNKNGSATDIYLGEKAGITSLKISLLSGEGEYGLCEAEAFGVREQVSDSIVKLTDCTGNFLYDYWLQSGEDIELSVYEYPAVSESDLSQSYTVKAKGGHGCTAEISGSHINVHCPKGKKMTVTLYRADKSVADVANISNPRTLTRAWWRFIQRTEVEYGCSLSEYQRQYYNNRIEAFFARLR